MMYRLSIFCMVFIVLVFAGCSESSNPTSPDGPDDVGVPPLIEDSYHPLSIGSYWKYTGAEAYTQQVTGGTMIDGKYFFTAQYIISGSPTDQYEYLREEAQTLYSLTPTFAPEAYPLLKYNLPLGSSWTFTRTVQSTKNYYLYTIVAKDIERTVLGRNYSDVLQVRGSNFAIMNNGDTLRLFDDFDFYYAKGVGTIEYDKPLVGTTYLQEYFIKK